MRLHHLRMRGIGPFRDEVDLDLAALGAGGLFLLEGPTGSGKSTILDAIVYALYGSVAGKDADGARIRSQFCPPSEPSAVDLIFETGSGIYRVRREPEYQRPKKTGQGTTRQQAKALLWRLGSPEAIPLVLADQAGQGAGSEPLSTRLDEVGAEITRAIGLTREQFTQTVLLPQGEFARFLRARTEERRAVLTRVFGTEIYQELENELVARRKDAKAQVARAAEALGAVTARFVEAAGCEDETAEELAEWARELQLDAIAERADAFQTQRREEASAFATAAQEAAAALSTAREAAETSRQQQRLRERRRQLDELSARLESQTPEVMRLRKALRLHEAAAPVAEAERRRLSAGTRTQEALSARDHAIASARAADDTSGAAEGAAPDLAQLAEQNATDPEQTAAALAEASDAETARAAELGALAETERALPERARTLASQEQALQNNRAEITAQDEALAARPVERTALVAARDAVRQDAARLPEAQLAAQRAQGVREAAVLVDQLSAQVEAAAQTAAQTLSTASASAEQEAQLRRRRHAGLAAELALTLDTDQECPVCGSTEHPHPAQPEPEAVGLEDVERAEQERREADAAAASARTALAVLTERRDSARDAAGEVGIPEAQQALTEAEAAVTAARDAATEAARLDTRIQQHDEQTRALEERRHRDHAAAEALAARLERDRAALTADQQAVTAARADHPSVSDRLTLHRRRARVADALREAVLEAHRAQQRETELAAEVAQTLHDAQQQLAGDEGGGQAKTPTLEDAPTLTDVAAAQAAVLPARQREQGIQVVREHEIARARLTEGMAEEGIAAALATPEALAAAAAELAERNAALTAAEEVARTAQGQAARAETVARRTEAARTALAEATDRVQSVRASAGTVMRVADLATGGSADGDRISLSTFVLMRRFDEVITAANTRLTQLSGADLELVRDSGARGARRTGLDLQVIDRRTDQMRVPETLSGGETFFVSLALAQGLADIVTAEAGGVTMETLFIDEGFGSLDPERLDAVIEEITHLADTGRTVGIVSHVTELKTRIPEQIHVRRRADQTSAVTVTA